MFDLFYKFGSPLVQNGWSGNMEWEGIYMGCETWDRGWEYGVWTGLILCFPCNGTNYGSCLVLRNCFNMFGPTRGNPW